MVSLHYGWFTFSLVLIDRGADRPFCLPSPRTLAPKISAVATHQSQVPIQPLVCFPTLCPLHLRQETKTLPGQHVCPTRRCVFNSLVLPGRTFSFLAAHPANHISKVNQCLNFVPLLPGLFYVCNLSFSNCFATRVVNWLGTRTHGRDNRASTRGYALPMSHRRPAASHRFSSHQLS